MILTVILEGRSKAAIVLSVLMKVYTIPCHDRGYIKVTLVLQSCTDPLHILPGSSSDTYATSSDGAFIVGNVKVEEDLDMQEEEGEVKVKTEKDIGSEEEECIGMVDEEGIYSEEEEENVDTKEEEDIDIKEEVSLRGYSIMFYEINAEPN
jgi:uncharacterized membrane protein